MLPIVAALAVSSPIVRIAGDGFVYTTGGDGKASVWENRATGSRIDLGGNPEVEIEVGDRPEAATRVVLHQASSPDVASDGKRAVLHLESADGQWTAGVTLEADPKWPVLHKWVEVIHRGGQPTRLLNLVLGRFPVGKAKSEGGDRGFPLYLDQDFFLSIAHPAGFAHLEPGAGKMPALPATPIGRDVVLRQYPGAILNQGDTFHSMEALYGVAPKGGARKLFVDYVRSRMIRVRNGHDKPFAILEAFGGQPDGDFKNNFSVGISADYLLRHLGDVAQSERDDGVQFDFYSIEFWHDRAGTLKEFNPQNFPSGFAPVRDKILGLGMKPGLWIDSGGLVDWSVDLNPATRVSRTISDGQGSFCRASEPIASIYKDGFLYQMSENKVGLLKFDNLAPVCVNPAHEHLPGPLYSTEAIYDSLIDFLLTLRQANPDEFIMLYWGYHSPWWLLYGDTYFESGQNIEAASPAQFPAPYARDSVTQRLDQAQLGITDTPWLGKDSLGVWLSNWSWNSGIGKDRWQEGVVMDMARGSLLLQIWTDADFLTPPERDQLATFIDLLKANPDCFENPRFILGDPNKAEPYGYSCSNGKKAFLSIMNAALADSNVKLDIGQAFGLPAGRKWDIYRWYPRPAKLSGASIWMRPYEVDLLEVVPAGDKPSLGRSFVEEAPSNGFAEKTRALPLSIQLDSAGATPGRWSILQPRSATSAEGAMLKILRDKSILAGGKNPSNGTYLVSVAAEGTISGLMIETLTDDSLPAHGPGRAVDGNFALTDLKVRIENGPEIRLASAAADFSQTSYGGWPVEAAIDEDPKSGWSIHPEVGESHAAVFRFERPVTIPNGARLLVTMRNGDNGHALGRFRFSATTDSSPAVPQGYLPGRLTVTAELPPTKLGGQILLVGGAAGDAPQALLDGQGLPLASVWSTDSNWACPWVAWRGAFEPSDSIRRLQIVLDRRRTNPGSNLSLSFLPK